MDRKRVAWLVAAAAVLAGGCDGGPLGSGPPEIASITVNPASGTLHPDSVITVSATAVDSRGRTIDGVEYTWTSSDSTILAVSKIGEVVAMDLGTAQVRASAGGKVGIAELTVVQRPVARVQITPGSWEMRVATSAQFVVTLLDGRGYPLSGRQVAWSSSDTTRATVSPQGVVTAREMGTVNLVATAEGVRDSAKVTITAGEPARLEVVGGNNGTATVGAALADSLAVRVTDAFGNPVRGVAVTWTAGAGSVAPLSGTTDAVGQARTLWTLGTAAGAQAATAAAAGMTVTFTASATPGAAASLTRVGGHNQTGPVGRLLPDPLVVRVTDAHGNAVPGAAVAWNVIGGAGSVNPSTSQTNAQGRASTLWTLGSQAGAQSARASMGTIAPVTFAATATATPPVGQVRIVTFGDSNTDFGYRDGTLAAVVASYISRTPIPGIRLGPNDPHSQLQLAGKIETEWRRIRQIPIRAVNHAIGGTSTAIDRGHPDGPPNARTLYNGVTRFEAEVLGLGAPWDGGGIDPVVRVNAFRPGPADFAYLSIGTNDAFALTTEQTIANLRWMIQRWLAGGLRADHLILTTLAPNVRAIPGSIPAINQGIRALAAEYGVHLIDLGNHTSADGLNWRSDAMHLDGVHYTERVRQWLAERVVSHMASRIPAN
jgi:hypothetical protein